MRHSWSIGLGLGLALAVAAPAFANDSPSYGYGASPATATGGEAMAKVRVAIDAKDWSGAIAILYKLSQSDSQNADVENLLGYSYRMLGQYPQSFAYYDKALALDPMHKGALEYEGEAYLETNQLPKAEVNLSRLQAACPGGCAEIAMLQTAIDRYKAKAKVN